jgi:hypothetical protein
VRRFLWGGKQATRSGWGVYIYLCTYQAKVTLDRHDHDHRRALLLEQGNDTAHMPPNERSHVEMVGDHSVVEADDLHPKDIYKLVRQADNWRSSRDLIFRLLVNEDEEELEQHILGIISAPGTTMQPSLLEQSYSNTLSPRTLHVFWRLQNHKQLGEFKNNTTRRTQLHFILFVTMGIENEFCQYVVQHCTERGKLRTFINESVKPALARLLQGELLTTRHTGNSMTAFGVAEFVAHCRFAYMTTCDVRPIDTGAPVICR